MARRVTGPAPGSKIRFVPKAFDNQADQDPVVFWLRAPTERERRELDKHGDRWAVAIGPDGKVRKGPDGEPLMFLDKDVTNKRAELAAQLFVVKVDHYTATDDSPIDTGEKLAEHGDTVFLEELLSFVEDRMELEADLGKASSEQSGSASRESPPLPGTARNANETGSTSSEIASGKPTTVLDTTRKSESSPNAQRPGC